MASSERLLLRPRQVRYQAALRPDRISRIDSKARPNSLSTPNHDFRPRGVKTLSATWQDAPIVLGLELGLGVWR
jgi:hypothetical protein